MVQFHYKGKELLQNRANRKESLMEVIGLSYGHKSSTCYRHTITLSKYGKSNTKKIQSKQLTRIFISLGKK